MRFLNLDLDYFLNDVAYFRPDEARLCSAEYQPWSDPEVRTFLESQCGLSRGQPIPGRVVEHHDEAFDFWGELVSGGQLDVPFEVVHIDAHSDLGNGDIGYMYMMPEFLHIEPADRPRLIDRSLVKFGNYLAFAIGCRWISKLTYVRHPEASDDLPTYYFKDHDTSTDIIKLKKLERGVFDQDIPMIKNLPVLEFEPEVPFIELDGTTYTADSPFDLMLLSKSPGFTPVESDRLIPIISEYINLI